MTTPTTQEYVFKVRGVEKYTDGDTYWVHVSPAARHQLLLEVRLLGYDTPETRKGTPHERAQGKVASQVTHDWLQGALDDPARTLWIRTEPDPDNFGRWRGETWAEDAAGNREHLGDVLRARGLASVWPTRWRDEFETKVKA